MADLKVFSNKLADDVREKLEGDLYEKVSDLMEWSAGGGSLSTSIIESKVRDLMLMVMQHIRPDLVVQPDDPKDYDFTIHVVGHGRSEQEAWLNAKEDAMERITKDSYDEAKEI